MTTVNTTTRILIHAADGRTFRLPTMTTTTAKLTPEIMSDLLAEIECEESERVYFLRKQLEAAHERAEAAGPSTSCAKSWPAPRPTWPRWAPTWAS